MMNEVREHEDFLFAAVRGDYGEAVQKLFRYVIVVEVPKEIRLERVRNRSFQKFGDRMLPGGDLYEQEEAFFHMIADRGERFVEEWVDTVNCPVIRVDGTKPVKINVEYIAGHLQVIL